MLEIAVRDPVEVSGAVRCSYVPRQGFGHASYGSSASVRGLGDTLEEGSSPSGECYSLLRIPGRGLRNEGHALLLVASLFVGARSSDSMLCLERRREDASVGHVSSRCCENGLNCPVLKHGPRSLTYMRVLGCQTQSAQ